MQFPHRFIAIEGNIGAGKTTLCHMLAERFPCSLVLEQFTDNPFLPFFYENPERYAFPVELFFMSERHKQLQEHFSSPDLFSSLSIADYFFVKTLLFAKNNLNEAEFRLFQRLYGVLNNTFPKPDMLLYLHRPVDVLLDQIRKRGRDMERFVTGPYLEEIQNAYLEYFRWEMDTPVVMLDLKASNFMEDTEILAEIIRLLQQSWAPGMHRITL